MTASGGSRSIALGLVSHTNVGKTTLARTLLARDIGEVRDAAHVTEFAEVHTLLIGDSGESLLLWDTPGFGDSARLARRLRDSRQPIGWLLSQVWDRWRDRPFWSSQQALRAVREHADAVLYLVNAAEQPSAPYIEPELELLRWFDKPVLVLLNQLGQPREPAVEAAELQRWTAALQGRPPVRAVLPLDAFARCWVQEGALWQAVAAALPPAQAATMARLHAAWWARRLAVFEASMQALAAGVAQALGAKVVLEAGGARERWHQLGSALGLAGADGDEIDRAQRRLAALLDEAMRDSTARLITLHGLEGDAAGIVIDRVAAIVRVRRKVPEGQSAVAAGLVSGALGGLGADLASGGLTLGGGMIAGALLGALGAAGVARGFNLVRGTDHSWLAFAAEALPELLRPALLRYLAVAHFGRGRGDWSAGEAPAHWAEVVDQVLEGEAAAIVAVRSDADTPGAGLQPLLSRCARAVLERLYPGCWYSGSQSDPVTRASCGPGGR